MDLSQAALILGCLFQTVLGRKGLNAWVPVRHDRISFEVCRYRAHLWYGRIAFEVVLSAIAGFAPGAKHLELLAKVIGHIQRHREDTFGLVSGQALFPKVVAEALHEVGLNAKDIQYLKVFDKTRPLRRIRMPAAFEAPIPSFEPHATPKKLNDLSALAFPNMHQPHRTDAPAVPALHESLGPHQQVDG